MTTSIRFLGQLVRAPALCVVLGASLIAAACGDDSDASSQDGGKGGASEAGRGGSSSGGKGGTGGKANDDSASGGKAGSQPAGGAGGAGGSDDADTAIGYSINIADPEGYTEYLIASKDVPTGTIDTSKGLETKGGSIYYNENAIYYGNIETTTLQRYAVRKDYSVEKTGEFSLSKYGIEYVLNAPLFFSTSSAFYIDDTNEQLIHFDPTEMKILGEIPLPELHRDGWTWGTQTQGSQRAGDRYVVTIGYSNDDGDTALDTTVLIVEDDAEHPVKAVSTDKRAVAAATGFVNTAGDYYALADGYAGALPLLLNTPVQPSLVRVKHDSDEIDPDYLLDLGKLLNTPVVNGLWPAKGNKFVVQAWSPDVKPEDVIKTDDDLYTAPYFDWYVVDAESKEFTKLSGLTQPTTNSYPLGRLQDRDQLYIQQYTLEDKDYKKQHIDVFKLNDDGTTSKQFNTKLGDIRALGRVKIEDKK